MKILITGGNGFIARNLFEDLVRDHLVLAPSHGELDVLDGEAVESVLRHERFDVVIHCANYDANAPMSKLKKSQALTKNLEMFYNLARCSDHFGKMIYFGSGAEVPREERRLNMTEADVYTATPPADGYGLSKYIMNRHAIASDNIYNVRLFGVFGKYDDWRYRAIPNFCAQALHGNAVTVLADSTYDFLWIGDLVRAVRLLAEIPRPLYKVYNVCPGEPRPLGVTALMVLQAARPNEPVVVAKPSEPGVQFSGSPARFKRSFSDFKFTPMADAIRELYEWYEANRDAIPGEEVMRWL